jgi:hypothetical protein
MAIILTLKSTGKPLGSPAPFVAVKVEIANALRLKKASAHVRGMLRKIAKAHHAGDQVRANKLTGKYLGSLDARYVAAVQAYRGIKPHRRPERGALFEIAKNLNAWEGTQEMVTLILKEKGKDTGNFRYVMDFGIENRALQLLVKPILEIRGKRHSNQYAGVGTHAAIERVAALMTEGNEWAIETDITDCFPSFVGEKVQELLPLPKKVTSSVVLCASLNLSLGSNSIFGPADPGDTPDEEVFPELFADARRGIPQGSIISSLVAEILLACIFDQLTGSGQCIGYADNFLVVGKKEDDVKTTTSSLWSALKAHPAGQLRPNKPNLYKPGKHIDFLGHRLKLMTEKVYIRPTPANLSEFKSRFEQAINKIIDAPSPTAKTRAADELRRYTRSWHSAFKLWGEAVAHQAKHLNVNRRAKRTPFRG